MDSSYEFVGVVNLFDLYPDFLFPIYKNKNRFFFHNGAKNRIYNFEPVTMAIIEKMLLFIIRQKINIILNTMFLFMLFKEIEGKYFALKLERWLRI